MDFYLDILLLIFLLRKRRRKRKRDYKRKRFWVRSIFQRRKKQGEYHNLVQELRLGDREFYFRYLNLMILIYVFCCKILYNEGIEFKIGQV